MIYILNLFFNSLYFQINSYIVNSRLMKRFQLRFEKILKEIVNSIFERVIVLLRTLKR